MRILERFRTLQRRLSGYAPLVEVSISRANLLHNLRTYQERYPGTKIAPVLKSNAYGHDLGLIARLLDKEDIAFFMVDSLYEAHRLRQAGVRSRIVVMGYVRAKDIARSNLVHVDFAVTDIEQLRELASLARHPLRLHLKLDTGMHRQGIPGGLLPEALDLIRPLPYMTVVGACTHLADADSVDEAFSRKQLACWSEGLALVEKSYPGLEYRHIAATKGVRFSEECRANVARVGIGLYGFDTAPGGGSEVKPVLELRSLVTSIREIPAGDAVGYNATFSTARPTRIATVPVGYYEGIDRRLSNAGSMRIGDVDCPIAGRVSMNMSTLDITDAPEVARGDVVIALSRTAEHPNSVANIAARIGTIPYEVLVHVPPHLRRVVE